MMDSYHQVTTQGVLGAIGKPLVAAYLSHLETDWRFQVSMRPIFPSRRRTIYEEDKFYSSLMICDLIVFSN